MTRMRDMQQNLHVFETWALEDIIWLDDGFTCLLPKCCNMLFFLMIMCITNLQVGFSEAFQLYETIPHSV